MSLPIKFTLQSRYEIVKTLGQGGFGITYEVFDSKLEQTVCVKELFISGSSTRGADAIVNSANIGKYTFEYFTERFISEARKLAKFNHPNIVRVLDVFQENNTAYIVMDFAVGSTLKEIVLNEGPFQQEKIIRISLQILSALEIIHKNSILHRDIKPDNLIIDSDDRVVLIDFGSAREFLDNETMAQTTMLTEGYAPIEQYSSRSKMGPYTDLYSLGATMYFAATAIKPITPIDRQNEQFRMCHELNPNISTQLSSAISIAMEIDVENRFKSAIDFRQGLISLSSKKGKGLPIEKEPTERGSSESAKGLQLRFVLAAIAVIILTVSGNLYLDYFNRKSSLSDELIQPKLKSGEVRIGNQVWKIDNLAASNFNNGELIPQAKSMDEWSQAHRDKTPAWCYYDNSASNASSYGKLYNWFAVSDERGLAPSGWRIPAADDWLSVKSEIVTVPNIFGGGRSPDGTFAFQAKKGFWWSSKKENSKNSKFVSLSQSSDTLTLGTVIKGAGLSVRLVKDDFSAKK